MPRFPGWQLGVGLHLDLYLLLPELSLVWVSSAALAGERAWETQLKSSVVGDVHLPPGQLQSPGVLHQCEWG